jgi:hypothetical protein
MPPRQIQRISVQRWSAAYIERHTCRQQQASALQAAAANSAAKCVKRRYREAAQRHHAVFACLILPQDE